MPIDEWSRPDGHSLRVSLNHSVAAAIAAQFAPRPVSYRMEERQGAGESDARVELVTADLISRA